MPSNVTSGRLKEALLEDLVDRIENGEPVEIKEDGVVVGTERLPPPSTVLQAAIAFLKQFPPDDGLESAEISTKLKQYGDKLPFKASS